jgi:hypothetical protein
MNLLKNMDVRFLNLDFHGSRAMSKNQFLAPRNSVHPGSARAPRAVLRAPAQHIGRQLVLGSPWVPGCIPRGAKYGARGARAPQMHAVLLLDSSVLSRGSRRISPAPAVGGYFESQAAHSPEKIFNSKS